MFVLNATKILRPIFIIRFKRQLCSIDQLDNESILKLTKTSEDIASYVRFNRFIQSIDAGDYSELYSPKSNPNKTEIELKHTELTIQLICREYDYLCRFNCRIPSKISKEHMKSLLAIKKPERRQIFLIHWYFKETKKIRTNVKKRVKRHLKMLQETNSTTHKTSGIFSPNDASIQYGLWKNGLFLRINGKSPRILVQSGLNGILWGPVLAFDWNLPLFLDESFIREKFAKKLARIIFNISNENLKANNSLKPTFNIVHLGLTEQNIFKNHLKDIFQHSLLDFLFYNTCPRTFEELSQDNAVFYISPFAEKSLNDKDLKSIPQNKQIFIFNPFTEIKSLKSEIVKQILEAKEKELSVFENKVRFRRLPIHDYVSHDKHLVLNFFVQCLRDVICNSMNWTDALYKNVPRKYYKNVIE